MGAKTEWSQLLGRVLDDQAAVDTLSTDLAETRDVVKAIQLFCSTKRLSDNAIRQMVFIIDLFNVVDTNLTLFFSLMAAQPFAKSLAEIATRFYTLEQAPNVPKLSQTETTTFNMKIFKSHPTAVICGLLQANKICHEKENIQKEAVAFMTRALASNFNISLTSLPVQVSQDEDFKSLPAHERSSLIEYLKALQRLHVLVSDAADINLLIRAGFSSAHDIASTADFLEIIRKQGINENSALKIWRRAVAIDQRNEQRWADFIRSRTNIPVLALETGTVSDNPTDDRVSLANIFGEMEQAQVDEFTSVLSPAAYLVDLMELLRYAIIEPESPPDPNLPPPKPSTLLQDLLKRRPDLEHIQLSKPNTLNPVRYCDLANEVMEAFIYKSLDCSNNTRPAAYNECIVDTQDTASKPPAMNTIWDIYENDNGIIARAAPMDNFPFNLAFHTTRALLESAELSRFAMFKLFQDRKSMRESLSISDDTLAYALVDEAFDRRLAAESLGLDQDDFVAITQQAYMSLDFICARKKTPGIISKDDYETGIGLKTGAEYWGYSFLGESDSATGQMLSNSGLASIILEVLPKSGMSFQDLLTLLDTEYVAKTLIISVQDEYENYTEDYRKMRLRISPQAQDDGISFDMCCARLNSFIRLWGLLKWSIADLDAAIATVESARLSGTSSSNLPWITPKTIEDLSAIKQLSDLTGLPVSKLLPLWGEMRCHNAQSFYQTNFMTPGLLARFPALDTNKLYMKQESADENGEAEQDFDGDQVRKSPSTASNSPSTVADHLAAMQSAIGLDQSQFTTLCEISQIKSTSPWSVAAVSALYRLHLWCKMLGVTPARYNQWRIRTSEGDIALSNPKITLGVLQKWLYLQKFNGCSPTWLLNSFFAPSPGSKSSPTEEELSLIVTLFKLKLEIDAKYQQYFKTKTVTEDVSAFTNEHLVNICSSLQPSGPMSSKMTGLVEGSATFITPYNISTSSITIPGNLSSKVVLKSGTLILKALMTEDEYQILMKLGGANGQEWTLALTRVLCQSKSAVAVLAELCNEEDMKKLAFLYHPPTSSKDSDDRVEAERAICVRRKTFINTVLPYVKRKELSVAMERFLRDHFPSVPHDIATSVLSNLVFKRPEQAVLGADPLSAVLSTQDKSISTTFSGFYLAMETGETVFNAPEGAQLAVDGKSVKPGTSTTLALTQDKLCKLTFSGTADINSIKVSSLTTVPEALSTQSLILNDTISVLTNCLRALQWVSVLTEKFGLNALEMSILIKAGVNIYSSTWVDMESVVQYCELRSIVSTKDKLAFLDKVVGIVKASTTSESDIEKSISEYTGWDLRPISSFLIPKMSQVAAHGGDCRSVFRVLVDLKLMLSSLGKAGLPLNTLNRFVLLGLPGDKARDFAAAKGMTSYMLTTKSGKAIEACENLALKKNTVLISYLLSQEFFKQRKIYDANGLFEYFLIDVQMAAEQSTSRIQQAISTIQLYIQRCLLGFEVKSRLRVNTIDRKRWGWMQKFTLWQANRRVFLFPENWVESSLRDDKSEVFRAIEGSVLQANLGKDKIVDIIRQYIQGAHQVADLEVQAYVWEKTDQFRGTYHLFARTRTAPYGYYYRPVRVTGVQVKAPVYNWHPWTRLEVDVPTYESEWDGTSLPMAGSYLIPSTYGGRLFLFMPHIMMKTQAKRPTGQTDDAQTFAKSVKVTELGTDSYWEVKMGWSECMNGVWSTKRVATSSLDVTGSNKNTKSERGKSATEVDSVLATLDSVTKDSSVLPGISNFRFWVRSKETKDYDAAGEITTATGTDILIIDVFRWICGDTTGKYSLQNLGRFELRGTHMVAVRDTSPQAQVMRSTTPTYFNKLHLSTTDSNADVLEQKLSNFQEVDSIASNTITTSQPLMALAPAIKADDQKLVWTMSFNESQCKGASGIVVERMTGSRIDTYFNAPNRNKDGSLDMTKRIAEVPRKMAYDTSQQLMEASSTSSTIEDMLAVLGNVRTADQPLAFGGRGVDKYSELAESYSIYNWELGFHLIMLLVERLLSTQQFELGLQVANLVFDPWSQGSPDKKPSSNAATTAAALPNVAKCWRFPPFRSSKMRLAGSMGRVVKQLKAGRGTDDQVDEWLSNPFNAHSLARGRPAIYMRRMVTKYIELLIESGDELFRKNSMESIPMALQRYVQAAHLFGSAPRALPSPTKPTVKTYAQIFNSVDDFSSASVDLELTFPFFSNAAPGSRGTVNEAPRYKSVLGMVRSSYFPVPMNPDLAGLRDRIDVRLYQVRHGLDINGNKRRLPLFDPPLDPSVLVRAAAAGGSSGFAFSTGVDDGPMPNYRFLFLLQKAFEMCNELKSMGDAYLTIKEKRDAEKMASLRATQDASTQVLFMQIKKMQKQDAEKAIQVLEETRESHVMKLKYYLALIGQPETLIPDAKTDWQDIQQAIAKPTKDEFVMSPEELLESQKIDEATFLKNIASGIERSCSVLMALPNLSSNIQPFGMGASLKFDAANVAQGMQLIAAALQSESSQRSDEASKASRKGQLLRQLQERRLSANTTGRDIKNTDCQLESQRIKLEICDREIQMQQKSISDTSEMLEYMTNKYTNERLYSWMDASMRNLLYQTYILTMDVAKSAEKAFLFERGLAAAQENVLANSYWDAGQDGAFAAQNLYLGLKRIESAYHRRRSHDFEITKDVSLRQIDPWALLKLRETGSVQFSLPELLFDMDFPGHFCRRIKAVSITVPCVHGPYTSVACTLRLLSHCYRLRQSNGADSAYYPQPQELDNDARYKTDRIPIASIAVSTASQDNGSFEIGFSGERYGAFEGAGVISSWALDLPKLQQFDYRTISDVILQVKYTAVDGGAGWTEAASKAVMEFQGMLGDKMYLCPFELSSAMMARPSADSKGTIVEIRDIMSQMPIWTRSRTISLKQTWIIGAKNLKLSTNVTINDLALTESSKMATGMKVLETIPGTYEWDTVTITMPEVTSGELRRQSVWLLIGFNAA